jgi:transcriptional regulator with XRE-family HTH domain
MSTIVNEVEPWLANCIKTEREARGWSLDDLAERSGVSKAMISNVERGESSPTAALLGRLSEAFGLTLSTLLARAEGVRANAQAVWQDPATGYRRTAVSPEGSGVIDLVRSELLAGASVAGLARVNAREWPSQAEDAEKDLGLRERPGQPSHSSPHTPRGPSPQADQQSRPFDAYEGAALHRARNGAPSISPWLFVMATALNTMVASILAVIITLGVVKQERSDVQPRDAPLASAYARPAVVVRSETTAPNVAFQQINLGPIVSPNQPLRLEPRKPAQLSLHIEPEEAANEPFILALSDAPAGTMLSGATQISSDTWFLSPGSAGRLEIALPEWSTSVFEITIVLRRTNGLVAAQTKAWIAVPPPPSRLPAGPKIGEATAKDLVARADRLLEKGDIVGARAIYQRAAELGDASAALALGATYDPNRLWSLGALGLVGNKERARQWYLRASELGHREAKARLTILGF